MNRIFGLSGKAFSGKDSTALIMKKYLPGKSLILHNADLLKYYCKEYLGWDGQKNDEGRKLLQTFGSEKVRYGLNKPLFWIEKTCDAIEILQNDFDYFFIADQRFKNEVYYLNARFPDKVTSIYVERLNFNSPLTPEQQNHVSEVELDNFDFDIRIRSESGLEKLAVQIFNTFDFNSIV